MRHPELTTFSLRSYAVSNGVTCNSVDPGIVPGTRLLRDQSETVRALQALLLHNPASFQALRGRARMR